MTPATPNLKCECGETQRLSWSFKTDEVTCSQCGIVGCLGDFVVDPKPAEIMPTFRPLFDQILIQPVEAAKQSEGGLFIPDNVKPDGALFRGKVLAVGKGEIGKDGKRIPLETRPGDEVLYYKNPSTEITVPDINEKCTVIHEEQYAVAVLEP